MEHKEFKVREDVKLSNLKQYGFKKDGNNYIYHFNTNEYDEYFYISDLDDFKIVVKQDRSIELNYGIEFSLNNYPQNILNPSVWSDNYTIETFITLIYNLIKDNVIEEKKENKEEVQI